MQQLKRWRDCRKTAMQQSMQSCSISKCQQIAPSGLINQTELPSEKLPIYSASVPKVKSINISILDDLVQDYSREFNISQKDIFQIALVEFFKNMATIMQ